MSEETQAPDTSDCEGRSVKTGIFAFNPRTFSITRASDVFSGMLGYSLEELASFPLSEIWPNEVERERFFRSIDEQKAIAGYSADLSCRDGTLLPVTIAASSFPDTDVTCIVSSHCSDTQTPPEQEEYLRIINNLPDAVFILDWDGIVLFANTAAARLIGRPSPADLLGRNAFNIIHSDYSGAVSQDLSNVRSKNDGYLAHYLMRDLNGNEKWIEGLGTAIPFKGREANVVVLRDITERKTVEGKIARTNQQYRSLYQLLRLMCDNVPDLIWAKDIEKHFLFTNKAICERLLNAVDTDEPVGKTDMFFALRERNSRPDDPTWHTFGEICRDSDTIVMEGGNPERFDEFGNVKGEFLFLDVHKAPLWDEDGQMIGTVGCGRDVTKERQIEEKLRWNEALLSQMMEASPIAHLVVNNRTDEILYFDNTFCEMWGLTHLKDEMRAGNLRNGDIAPVCLSLVKDWSALAASFTPLQDEEVQGVVEDEIELADGRCIRRITTQIRDPNDKYFGRLYLFEDITERKRISEALLQHDAIVNAVNFAADRFLKEEDWKQQMPEALERLGRAADVSRVYIFENGTNPAGEIVCSQRWEWTADGIGAEIDNPELQYIPYGAIGRWYDELGAGKPIVGPVRTFPDIERAYLEPQRIQSVAVVPIFIHQQFWGFIGFDENRKERIWSPTEIDALQAAANIIGSAILRMMNEEVYRNPVERSPVGVYLLQDRRLKYVNARFAEIFGYSRDELHDLAAHPLIAPYCLEDVTRRLQAVLSGDIELGHHEFRGVCKDERVIFLENFATRLQFEGRPAIVGNLVDVTERKRADEELKNTAERLQRLFDYAPEPFYLTDTNGVILDGNQAAEKMLGSPKEEFLGKTFADVGLLSPEDLLKVKERLDQLVDGTVTGSIEFASSHEEGTSIYVEGTTFPVVINGQQQLLTIVRDVSERYQLENLKKKALLQIEENIEQLAILNDSIRNPLTVIIGLAEMGESNIDKKIVQEAWAINKIIDQLDQGWLVSKKVKEFLKKHYI